MTVHASIVHRTPGLLDIQAITVMGLSAKPRAGGHPIGQFGTGLKYAVATLVRLGAKVQLFIGEDEYEFVKRVGQFRGEEYEKLVMRKRRNALWRTETLPYTTQYGRYWKPWMAFRELESNTIDEGGETWADTWDQAYGLRDHTTFVITLPEYVEAWEKRAEVFLPEGLRVPGEGAPSIQCLPGTENEYLYYRGLRVYQLPKRSVRTYNFLQHLELTEDRTLTWDWMARHQLAVFVMQSDDYPLVEDVLLADESYWEHGLEFPKSTTPSETFNRVVRANQNKVHHTAYWGYASSTPYTSRDPTPWERHERPWHVERGDEGEAEVYDKHGKAVLSAPADFQGDWGAFAEEVVTVVNRHGVGPKAPTELPEPPPEVLALPAPAEVVEVPQVLDAEFVDAKGDDPIPF